MTDHPDKHEPSPGEHNAPARGVRVPSPRVSVLLAALMLGIGVAVGAAIGPAPEASLAGEPGELVKRLPLLLAAIEARQPNAATASAATPEPVATHRRKRHRRRHREEAAVATTETTPSEPEPSGSKEKAKEGASKKQVPLPPVSTVWLIELSGSGFSSALASATTAPFIDQTVGQGTLLSEWSAISASAFASDVGLLEPPSATGPPPVQHTIVQPPCPEGAACTAEAGALSAANAFLQTTLTTITSTPAYKEHGLVVITFTTVGLPAQAGLPEGTSSATLTDKPPAGALLLSPFAKAGQRSSTAFDPTSPRQSAEALLHK